MNSKEKMELIKVAELALKLKMENKQAFYALENLLFKIEKESQ